MNARTMAVRGEVVALPERTIWLSFHQLCMSALIALIVLSALALIYVKDLDRRLFITYQSLLREETTQTAQYQQLLLAESAWSREARIQEIATQKLQMVMPDHLHTVYISGDSR